MIRLIVKDYIKTLVVMEGSRHEDFDVNYVIVFPLDYKSHGFEMSMRWYEVRGELSSSSKDPMELNVDI